eukprot:scaffold2325_cov135-Skeletonema_menzelii.AAC.1
MPSTILGEERVDTIVGSWKSLLICTKNVEDGWDDSVVDWELLPPDWGTNLGNFMLFGTPRGTFCSLNPKDATMRRWYGHFV